MDMLTREKHEVTGKLPELIPATINADDMIFVMEQASTQYTRPREAVIRELTANALDSHAVAGQKSPVIVTLPGIDHPCITVQDFGTGLSYTDVLEVFHKYYRSTKRRDSTQLGHFGVGAKVPYAVSDQYRVTAVKNGIRILVLFMKTQDGTPGHALLDEHPTDEPDGVTITVPLSDQEIDNTDQWSNAAKHALLYVEPGSVILNDPMRGTSEEPLNYTEYINESLSTERVKVLFNKDGDHPVPRRRARVGHAGYEIPLSMYPGNSLESVMVLFDIPTSSKVPIAPSRESLKESEHTFELLLEAVREWDEHIKDVFAQRTQHLSRGHSSVAVIKQYQDIVDSLGNRICQYLDITSSGNLLKKLSLPGSLGETVLSKKQRQADMDGNSIGDIAIYDEGDKRRTLTASCTNLLVNPDNRTDVFDISRDPVVFADITGKDKDSRAERIVNAWRAAHHYPALLVLPTWIDPKRIKKFVDIDKDGAHVWTVEDLKDDTPSAKAAAAEDPKIKVIRLLNMDSLPTKNITEEVYASELREEIAASTTITSVVAGTMKEYKTRDRHNPIQKFPAVRSTVLTVLRGPRSNEKLSTLLGTAVHSFTEYSEIYREQVLSTASAELLKWIGEQGELAKSNVDYVDVKYKIAKLLTHPQHSISAESQAILSEIQQKLSNTEDLFSDHPEIEMHTMHNIEFFAESQKVPAPKISEKYPRTMRLLALMSHTKSDVAPKSRIDADLISMATEADAKELTTE